MSSNAPSNDLIFLIKVGKSLQELLHHARSERGRPRIEWNSVAYTVEHILGEIKDSPSKDNFPQESIHKLLKKVQVTLEQLIMLDSKGKQLYEHLIQKLHDFKYQKPTTDSINDYVRPYYHDDGIDGPHTPLEPDFDAVFGALSDEEQKRLGCFLLFPAEAAVKRREVIHCWVGLGLTDSAVCQDQLAKLVETGLIQRIMLNKKVINRYKMPKSVRDNIQGSDHQESKEYIRLRRGEKPWSILHVNKEQQSGNNKAFIGSRLRSLTKSVTFKSSLPGGNADPEALLNVHHDTLNAAKLKILSGMHKLKVVHLGNFQSDSGRYIFVDDVESFKYLKSLKQVAFLSLAGAGGIEKLPKVIYELRKLKVLDLKGCSNLEVLPSGIESLTSLTHLDLSECYLLDHVPLEITFLTNLQVLKGFVVNNHLDLGIEKKAKGNRRSSSLAPCPFSELSKLNQLRKLTILNRSENFPTKEDLQTLREMEQLSRLRIVWMGSFSNAYDGSLTEDDHFIRFPAKLMKLDLQGAPEQTVSRLIRLISEDDINNRLEKLYIRGGGLRELEHMMVHPKIVRLRFLSQLQIQWRDFAKLFPHLSSLQVFKCPNLNSFPCDANGMWQKQTLPANS